MIMEWHTVKYNYNIVFLEQLKGKEKHNSVKIILLD